MDDFKKLKNYIIQGPRSLSGDEISQRPRSQSGEEVFQRSQSQSDEASTGKELRRSERNKSN